MWKVTGQGRISLLHIYEPHTLNFNAFFLNFSPFPNICCWLLTNPHFLFSVLLQALEIMTVEEIYRNALLKVVAYTMRFLSWTESSPTDCMSSNWRSVKKTRRSSYVNRFWTALLLIYVAVYVIVQVVAGILINIFRPHCSCVGSFKYCSYNLGLLENYLCLGRGMRSLCTLPEPWDLNVVWNMRA